jgi:hypothetical protein
VGSVLIIFFSFVVVLLCICTFWVSCRDVRYDFCITTMFGSSLLPVVCRRAHVLFTLFVFVCVLLCPTHIVLCVCLVYLRLVLPIMPVSLDCQFFIAPSVLSIVVSNTYCVVLFFVLYTLCCQFFWSVHFVCTFRFL